MSNRNEKKSKLYVKILAIALAALMLSGAVGTIIAVLLS